IHGAATGADTQAGQAARDRGLEVQEFPADWKRLGRSAGQVRNRRMFDATQPDLVIAFHDDLSQSRGTRGMVDYALSRGAEVYLISSEEDLAGLPEVLRRVAAEAELPEGGAGAAPSFVSTATNPKRQADKTRIERELGIPEQGSPTARFLLPDGRAFAEGYLRVVYGDRGPYFAFAPDEVRAELVNKINRPVPETAYYEWKYPQGFPDIKVYHQRRTVGYADYRPGLIYVAPDQLRFEPGPDVPPPLPEGVTKRPRTGPWPKLELADPLYQGFDFARADAFVINLRDIPADRRRALLDHPDVVY